MSFAISKTLSSNLFSNASIASADILKGLVASICSLIPCTLSKVVATRSLSFIVCPSFVGIPACIIFGKTVVKLFSKFKDQFVSNCFCLSVIYLDAYVLYSALEYTPKDALNLRAVTGLSVSNTSANPDTTLSNCFATSVGSTSSLLALNTMSAIFCLASNVRLSDVASNVAVLAYLPNTVVLSPTKSNSVLLSDASSSCFTVGAFKAPYSAPSILAVCTAFL